MNDIMLIILLLIGLFACIGLGIMLKENIKQITNYKYFSLILLCVFFVGIFCCVRLGLISFSTIKTIFYSILLLNFLIFFHELGHFLAALISKTKVKEFSIGMGPIIISKEFKNIQYSLRLFLIGGYVQFDDDSFKETHFLKQAFIIANGVIFNMICALVCCWLYLYATMPTLSLYQIFIDGFLMMGMILQEMYAAIAGLFKTVDTSSFAGPIGVVNIISTYVKEGYLYVLELLILFNVNLAVLNFLPIPLLDGGQFIYILFKGITKKQEYPKLENILVIIGVSFIVLLLIFGLFNDVKNFIFK